jgi:acyl-CoA thioester hydrolase
MPIPAPFVSKHMDIEKDWIDYNGHLNMAYYNVLFDRCSDEAFEAMGMGLDYVKQRRLTIYTAMRAAHSVLPMPERAGRSIGIKRK